MKFLLFFIFCLLFEKVLCCFLNAIILSQDVTYEEEPVKALEFQLKSSKEGQEVKVYLTHRDFENVVGTWAIWPLLRKIPDSQKCDFFMFLEPFTKVDDQKLIEYLKTLDPEELHFLGDGLTDAEPVIIHHFYGFETKETKITYPDFGAGVVISRGLLMKLLKTTENEYSLGHFSIDAKFELAKFIHEFGSTSLKTNVGFCMTKTKDCFTWFEPPMFDRNNSHCFGQGITNENVFFGIKTYSEYHKTRVVFVKRTWVKEVKYSEFFSDVADYYIPAVDLGVPNTEKGHCAKTFAILKHALEHEELNDVSWFVIADDDTLLSVPRLYRLLNCLSKTKKLIIGERYGYGFSFDGFGGYDYPTGGAGMVFSRPAARQLVATCSCPADDSPDDMTIGMCARRLSIPVIHSAAFHQARPTDYSPKYLNRQPPISFHKFENIDPYQVYADLLHEIDPLFEEQKKAKWVAQHEKQDDSGREHSEL